MRALPRRAARGAPRHAVRASASASASVSAPAALVAAAAAAAAAHVPRGAAALDTGAASFGRAVGGVDRPAAALLLIGVVGGAAVVALSALQTLLRRARVRRSVASGGGGGAAAAAAGGAATASSPGGRGPRPLRESTAAAAAAAATRAALVVLAVAAAAYVGVLFLDFAIALDDQLAGVREAVATLKPEQNPSRVWYMNGEMSTSVAHGILLTTALFVAVQVAMMLLVFVCTELSGAAPVEYAKRQEDVDGLALGSCVVFPCLPAAAAARAARDTAHPPPPGHQSCSNAADADAATAAARIHSPASGGPAQPPKSPSATASTTGSASDSSNRAVGHSSPAATPAGQAPNASNNLSGGNDDHATDATPRTMRRGLSATALLSFGRRHPGGCVVLAVVFLAMVSLVACGFVVTRRARYLIPSTVRTLLPREMAGPGSSWIARKNTITRLLIFQSTICDFSKLANSGALKGRCIEKPLPAGHPTPPPISGIILTSLGMNVNQCVAADGNSSAKLAACFTGFNNVTGRPAVDLPEVFSAFIRTPLFEKQAIRAVVGLAIVALLSVIFITVLWTYVLYAFGSRMCNMTFFYASSFWAVPLAVTLASCANCLLGGPISSLVTNVNGQAAIPVFEPPSAYIIGGAGPVSRVLINTSGAAVVSDFFVLFVAALINPQDVLLAVNRIARKIATVRKS